MPVACSTSALTGQDGSLYYTPAGTKWCLLAADFDDHCRLLLLPVDLLFSFFSMFHFFLIFISFMCSKSGQLYTFPTRTPVHYMLTMYQTQHFLGILFLIQAKSGFHYHMRVGNHEIMVFGCIRMNISREF